MQFRDSPRSWAASLLAFVIFLLGAAETEADYTWNPSEEELGEPAEISGPDLEEMIQDFVLETKRIQIAGFPDAFNPSIIRWDGRLLMCFRTYHPESRSTNEVALIHLSEDFEPIGEVRFLKFESPDPFCGMKRQDPRLIAIGGRLHIVYNNSILGETRRMLVALLETQGGEYIAKPADCLLRFDGEREDRSEKNWVPFDYRGELHLAYSIVPHKIFVPLPFSSYCETAASTLASFKWNWGVLRGGTPALLEGDEYLAFFHCSKSMATQHSKGKSIPHYFMGAYMFSSKPPFRLTRVSPEPIVGKNFYKGRAYKTWKPLRVVFPGGYVSDDRFIWILYGRQDHEIWAAKLDKQKLIDSLTRIPPP